MKHYRPHIFVVVALAIALSTGWHGALRSALTDLRFAWQSRQASGDIVVVAIDAPSIEKIGVWPWPRHFHADLLRRLESADVKDVVFDVDFSTPSNAASDQAFVEALQAAGGSVVLPAFKQPATDASNSKSVHINRPLDRFGEHSWMAIVNVAVERDGLVRRYSSGDTLDGKFYPSMGVVLAGQQAAKDDRFLIDFSIRANSIPIVSYVDVLRGDQAVLSKLKGKKVIIGGTALELGDRFSVPNGGVISGPVLQTLAAESILQNRTLRWTSDALALVGLCIISLIMMVSWRRLAAGVRVIVLVGMAAAIEVIALLIQAELPLVLDTSLLLTATAVYMAAIALDEIDFRDLLGRIAENRFQRIAMALGDGLVCTDSDRRITVWNPGATSIFGYRATEMIGRQLDAICADPATKVPASISIFDAAFARSQQPGGFVMEFEGRRRSGELFPVEACFSGWRGTDGFQYGAILRDISVRKREAERIRYLAEHDSLTGLANRDTFHNRLSAMIFDAGKQNGEVTLLVVGLDGFQHINHMLGHACGDRVLRAVSERLQAETAGAGIVGRLSGDEFAIAVPGAAMAETAAQLSERIALTFATPLRVGPRLHRLKASIGAAVYPGDGQSAEELLSNSHLAFSRAKATRGGGLVVFEAAIRQELESRLTLEAELAQAAERNEFELFYQPQVHLADGSLIGAEALIRWRHPVRGLVSPGEFMPVINTSSISERIAGWVLETACRQARTWELAGHGVRVGINLSPSQLQSGDLATSVAEILHDTGLTPALLELELTEDILLLDEQRVLDTFLRIRKLGVRVVFDDFGTGYASLTYLKKFPLDGLKIDRSFVLGLRANSDDAAIVSSTIGLSKKLGLSVIAEGIENHATADLLLSMGCEEGQGYFFGRPTPVEAFETQFMRGLDRLGEGGKAA